MLVALQVSLLCLIGSVLMAHAETLRSNRKAFGRPQLGMLQLWRYHQAFIGVYRPETGQWFVR